MATTDPNGPSEERHRTDESLRLEREKADAALVEHLARLDEVADIVINVARKRADKVLAAARLRVDQGVDPGPGRVVVPPAAQRARDREDSILLTERAHADEVLRDERQEHIALISKEREETDRDLLVERGRSDDALATRDELLAVVSHDLRNLLNAVMGFAALISLAVAKDGASPVLAQHADRIQRSGARMDRLIGDLVDVASIHAGALAVTREVQDPSMIVGEAVETFRGEAAARGITLASHADGPLMQVAMDPARILQVLSNLLSNAIKFTPPGGSVTVRLARVGTEARFSVADTGEGIPRAKLTQIFDRYVQADKNDRRGVGLGLYISRCIVQGHEGNIHAESHLGKGSTFTFTLPLAPPAPRRAHARNEVHGAAA